MQVIQKFDELVNAITEERTPEFNALMDDIREYFKPYQGAFFTRINGVPYIRPSVFYDITGNDFHSMNKMWSTKKISFYNHDLTNEYNLINGCGVLILNMFEYLGERGTLLMQEFDRENKKLMHILEDYPHTDRPDFIEFVKIFSVWLNVYGKLKRSPEELALYYVMRIALAPYNKPHEDIYKMIKYDADNGNVPALTLDFLREYVITTPTFFDKCKDVEYDEIMWNKWGSKTKTAISRNRVTPTTLAGYQYYKFISYAEYITAISNIIWLHYYRPFGSSDVYNWFY